MNYHLFVNYIVRLFQGPNSAFFDYDPTDRHIHSMDFVNKARPKVIPKVRPKKINRRTLICWSYWVPQKLAQIYTVIAYICIGKVA